MICTRTKVSHLGLLLGGFLSVVQTCTAVALGPFCLTQACLLQATIAQLLVAEARAGEELVWQAEFSDGSLRAGILRGIDEGSILLEPEIDGAAAAKPAESFASSTVRVIRRTSSGGSSGEQRRSDDEKAAEARPMVHVWMEDGSVLAGDDVALDEGTLWLVRSDDRVSLPARSVSRLAWADDGEAEREEAGLPPDPVWQSEIPAAAESDLIVIRKAADPQPIYQVVPCAILNIDAEHVTVALDDDRIPVKRERVAGLVWLRAAGAAQRESPAGPVVDVMGGRLLSTGVRLAPMSDSLTVATAWSDDVSIPLSDVMRIDLAAGRTVSLVDLAAEEVLVEPFFEGLSSIERLGRMFQPRRLPLPDGRPAMLLTPRTRMLWKLPAGVRRLRLLAQVERAEAGGADLVITVDGREVHRAAVVQDSLPDGASEDAVAAGIDIDVAGGRRLELLVDFPEASGGRLLGLGRVRLVDPRLEK